MQKKKVIVSVINDLVTDQRVARTCHVLQELNFNVLLIGRKLKTSKPLGKMEYECRRMRLLFEQGPQFYLFFNIRLFFVLLFTKADILFSNDLDTLLPNYLISKLKGIPLIYDSHEIFCEVPELQSQPFKKRIWELLESWIVPNLNFCITVNQSIANYFFNKYNKPFIYIRNIADYTKGSAIKSRLDLNLPTNKKIVILQGAGINIERGAEELLESFNYLDNSYLLLIIGSGDVITQLKDNATRFDINHKVKFIDKIPASELRHYTANANLGVSIDKDSNLNYHFSLPNKIFDYIHAGIPILATRLPEIERIILKNQIGIFIDHHDPKHIAHQINNFLSNPDYLEYKTNTLIASVEYNWNAEKQKLIHLLTQIDA